MSFTDVDKWIVGETDIFPAPQVVLARKDADCNLRQGSRTVRSATWALRVISLAFAMILLIVGCVAAQQSPSISVNGATSGTTVTAGAGMSVAVANGPGNATDWIGVCNAGVPISPTQCDGAGYSWDYLNCTQTAPTFGVSSATCSLPAPSVAGNYYAAFFPNNTYTVLASAPFQVTVQAPSSITVNGSSSGTTVSAGVSMSVAVANGPGNATDWIGVCNSGATPAFGQCDGAGYSWDYLNCDQTAPNTGVTSASCGLTAPSGSGSYSAVFFTSDSYTVLASAPFTVSGDGAAPAVVQSNSTSFNSTTQQCVWQVGQAIGTGDTIVGFVHSTDPTDQIERYPSAVTDNAGNTYTLSPGVHWLPWPEDIGIWYLTNVLGNPNTFTFTFANTAYCNVGFTEYSGSTGPTVVDPVLVSGTSPSITISPTAPSLIWAFAADFTGGTGSPLQDSGYSILIDNTAHNDIAVWGSNGLVPAGSLTLTWNAPYGTDCTPQGFSVCPSLLMAAAVH